MGRALILPSRAEAFPYIVLEAIGAKKPIFASNVGGVSEVFMEQADQLLPAADAQSLARAMQSFLDDDAPHISLTSLLHERVKTRFNLDVMATSVEAFYRRVQI
jgi:glycosyltransferase involved in cell wall biosynthesis